MAASPVFAVTFSDDTFSNADWSLLKSFDSTPGANAAAVSSQSTTGGNPGAFRMTTHDWTGPGGFGFTQLRAGAVYDPTVEGAIATIDFSFDVRFVGGSKGTSQVGYLLDVFQNGLNYFSSGSTGEGIAQGPGDGQPGDWIHFDAMGFEASNFLLTSGSGPANPDFSATGGPIQLGFLSANGSVDTSADETRSGIDNWVVTLNPLTVPEPNPLLLVLGGLLVLPLLTPRGPRSSGLGTSGKASSLGSELGPTRLDAVRHILRGVATAGAAR